MEVLILEHFFHLMPQRLHWGNISVSVLHMVLYVKMELAGKKAAGLKLPVTISNVTDFQQKIPSGSCIGERTA